MTRRDFEYDELLLPYQVAAMFSVNVKTVTRWARAGRFPDGTVIRTLGGERRYKAAVVRDLLKGSTS